MITGRYGYGSYDQYVPFKFEELNLIQKCQHSKADFDNAINTLMNQNTEECWELATELIDKYCDKWY